MRSTAIDRRGVLLGTAALPWASRRVYLGARATGAGRYAVSAFTPEGEILWTRATSARGHGLSAAPDGRDVVVFARRPGDFALLIAASTGVIAATIQPPDGLQFNGHGVFSADGRCLFATCTRVEDDSGWISVHDKSRAWRAVTVWPTQGSDPHEMLRLGDTLIVANGGLPGGKTPADANDVETSLVALDARDGTLSAQALPPADLRTVSLRHMTLIGRRVFVAGQDQEENAAAAPLLAVWEGGALRYHTTPELSGYCGSIAASGDALCLTSPKAGRAHVLAAEGGATRASLAMPDVCGAAPAGPGRFLLTSGHGDVRRLDAAEGAKVAGVRWDNHALFWQG